MRNGVAEAATRLSASWPGWEVWWVPRATGRPVVTWHARRRDETGSVLHAESADERDGLIELAGLRPSACATGWAGMARPIPPTR